VKERQVFESVDARKHLLETNANFVNKEEKGRKDAIEQSGSRVDVEKTDCWAILDED